MTEISLNKEAYEKAKEYVKTYENELEIQRREKAIDIITPILRPFIRYNPKMGFNDEGVFTIELNELENLSEDEISKLGFNLLFKPTIKFTDMMEVDTLTTSQDRTNPDKVIYGIYMTFI